MVAAAVAALLPWQVGLGLALGMVFVPLMLRWPLFSVYLLVLSVPVQTVIRLPAGLTVTQVVMALTLLAWWAWMATGGHRKIVLPGFAIMLGFYIVVMILSLIVTTSYSESLAEISRWLVVLLSYIIIANTVVTRLQVLGLVVCFLLSGFAEGALGMVQALFGWVPESFYVGLGSADDASARAFGTIGMPNSYAGFLNMTLPLAIALAVYFVLRLWETWQAERSRQRAERRGRSAEGRRQRAEGRGRVAPSPSGEGGCAFVTRHSSLVTRHSSLASWPPRLICGGTPGWRGRCW